MKLLLVLAAWLAAAIVATRLHLFIGRGKLNDFCEGVSDTILTCITLREHARSRSEETPTYYLGVFVGIAAAMVSCLGVIVGFITSLVWAV